jgi:hypothetical protein
MAFLLTLLPQRYVHVDETAIFAVGSGFEGYP